MDRLLHTGRCFFEGGGGFSLSLVENESTASAALGPGQMGSTFSHSLYSGAGIRRCLVLLKQKQKGKSDEQVSGFIYGTQWELFRKSGWQEERRGS